jgi:hypothetical protein
MSAAERAMSGWSNTLRSSGLAKQTREQRSKIDAVLFALWAQGHRERSPLDSALLIPVSRLIGIFVSLVALPVTLLRRLPEIATAGIFALLAINVFEDGSAMNAGILFVLVLLVLLRDQTLRFVRETFFDVGDFFLLGLLSRRYIDRHFLVGPLTVRDDLDGLKEHLFTSRILTSGTYQSEIEAFQKLVSRHANNWPELQSEIDDYWRKFPVSSDYWRNVASK